jgi:hypothetical protein
MFVTMQATFIQFNITQVYFNSVCYLYIVLHVSACTLAILRRVNTKILLSKI